MTFPYNYLDYMNSSVGFFCEQGGYLVTVSFDPITGDKNESGFEMSAVEVCANDFHNKERGNKRAIKKIVLERTEKWKTVHKKGKECPRLYDLVIGDDAGTTRASYLPMIRAYVIFKKWSEEISYDQEFDVMVYCPFCGAKLPERLDDKLTEILQKEYGLNSWRDYKKAPTEFHTDEWWKKRGL